MSARAHGDRLSDLKGDSLILLRRMEHKKGITLHLGYGKGRYCRITDGPQSLESAERLASNAEFKLGRTGEESSSQHGRSEA
jgi:hypothetical protein